jgi:hypothetical protein
VPPFSLVSSWGALNDAAAAADTGSGMAAGVATVVTKAADAIQRDGHAEDWTGWDVPLLTLYPDWSDATDRLEAALVVDAMPLTLAKWGWALFVADNTYANRATAAAKGVHVFPNSTTVIQAGEVGSASNASAANNGTNLDVVSQLAAAWTWDAGGVPRVTGRTKRTAAEQELTILGAPASAMAAASSRRLCLAAWHVAAVGGAVTLGARVYTRRIRTAGPFV